MWYLLRDIIWHKWKGGIVAVVTLLTVYSAIIENGFPDAGLPTMKDILPIWEWWVWILIALALLFVSAVAHANQQRRQLEHHDNWIIAHKAHFGKLPPVPDYLLPLVDNYTVGEPISKEIKLTRPSTQFWANLMPSQRENFLGLVEWLGIDPRDYEEEIKRHAPPGGHHIGLIWKK